MTANTPDNCYLDKGHDAHDLLAPGESCKVCGFMMMPPTPPEPTQQDRREAILALFKWENEVSDEAVKPIAEAIARARHAGEVAERERCARIVGDHAESWGNRRKAYAGMKTTGDDADVRAERIIQVCEAIAAAIRSLAPAEKEGTR